MLFVLDVGNTNTVLGVFARVAKDHPAGDADEAPRYERLVANWRVATRQGSTVDEYGVLFRNLFSMASLKAVSYTHLDVYKRQTLSREERADVSGSNAVRGWDRDWQGVDLQFCHFALRDRE